MRLPSRSFALISAILLVLVLGSFVPLAQHGPAPPSWPGPQSAGVTLLPNGWRIAPAGRHVQIGDLPLGMAFSPDGRFLVVSNNGYAKPSLTVYDAERGYVTQALALQHAWLGLAWHPDGTRLYSSGGNANTVEELSWKNGRLEVVGSIVLGQPQRRVGDLDLEHAGFVGGIAVSPDGKRLYASLVYGESVAAVDLTTRGLVRRVEIGAEPYTCLLSADGTRLFVSLWGGAKVLIFDADTLTLAGEVAVGEHPNAMVLSLDGARLYVACANTNAVWVVDLATRTAKEQISVALYPDSPVGTTPNALALSPDGRTLLVANADNNTVAVADVATPWASEVEGFIPVGWYPTAVTFDRAGRRVFVANGKGLASQANPRGPQGGVEHAPGQYTGQLLQGALSMVNVPDPAALKRMTAKVYELTPYTAARRLAPAEAPADSPVPRRVGEPSPIKYVFYIIRENRTYDQVLGDLPRGNGDPTLTLFGEEVTPNAHALATEFVLFDNFYVDAEVSYDGHAFSTGAYATDFVEKMWPTNYGGRGGLYLSEGRGKMRNPYGNVAAPPEGYLWDFARRAGLTVRSYGEFVTADEWGGPNRASVPGLEGLVHPTYPPYNLKISDLKRLDIWLEEFRRFDADGTLPRLSILHLPNDHTAGTSPGMPTPRAMVAENDLALGRIVEAVSRSRYWRESAIFVLEDDSQNGPDHVDAHRSVALVVSPFARRGALDSTLYTTTSVLRTIELILGLPPMSQYDAAATPMYRAFDPTPDARPFAHLPARWPLDEKNDWNSPGAQASQNMNLHQVDRAPELELNQVIWQSVHGPHSVMPPPRRTVFVRPVEGDDEE